jgi:type II restriction/modification system DNA methylase subunit YeeA
MNKSDIKKFAVQARNQLIKEIDQKAYEIGIEKDKIHSLENNAQIHGRTLNSTEINQRNKLIEEIKQKGYEQVIDEVAYTWFNRFIALRFMEVNGYLPTGVKVLSSKTEGKIEPDIIQEALNIDLDIEAETVHQFEDNNNTNGLYRYLLIKQCNSLNDIMPFIFEKIEDYTEILLPNDLLKEDSVIRNLVENIDNEDWQDVEIIGWIYQFYISEKKDEVFGSKGKVKKEEIPAATQLFTPDWIVRYMVENSLGRYWLESNANDSLKNKWEYYLEEAEQEPEVKEELEKIRDRNINPEEITFLDPAAGSGHILVYAFEVLYDIYKSAGYMESSIPQFILNKNLYGLEICDRAAQLASLSVMMKARQKDSRIFEKKVDLNIVSIQESNIIDETAIDLLVDSIEEQKYKNYLEKDLKYLVDLFEDAKNYGSILKIDHDISIDLINKALDNLNNSAVDLFGGVNRDIVIELVPRLLEQYKIMKDKYDVVVTNPPYMGSYNMNKKLKKYIYDSYKKSKKDLYAVFIENCLEYSKSYRYIAMITQHSWMFLSSFKKFRKKILDKNSINSLVHLGTKAFQEIDGEVVQTASFVFINKSINNYKGKYIRLVDYQKSILKHKEFFNSKNYFNDIKQKRFKKIPGNNIAYWVNDNLLKAFEGESVSDYGYAGIGMRTGDNARFLRYWYEVDIDKIGIERKSAKEAIENNDKWIPYNKGGYFRKWYGNNEYVVNWENNGEEIKENTKKNYPELGDDLGWKISNEDYYFRPGITWTGVTSGIFSCRNYKEGFIFDSGANGLFPYKNKHKNYLSGLLNSKVGNYILKILNPTINTGSGTVRDVPVILDENQLIQINNLVNKNIDISIRDWNSFETSWDFKKHPLLTHKNETDKIKEAFNNWSEFAEEEFYQLKENEEKLNEIFIEIYGLEDELDPKVKEKNVTVRKADRARDIRSFMSYAVGCMLGRYSLDEEGLVYAGGEFDHSKYETFKADKDGIIPVLDKEYFDDDIVARFVEFVKATFGEENLEENLEYIADALIEGGTSGQDTARETIRRYFLFDFIKDHTSEYNKCPIYWLFQSDGRGKAFNALIYMHRYDKGTVSRVRTDYLHELQNKIESEKVRLQNIIDSDLSGRQRTQAKKDLEKLEKQTAELKEYDRKLNHLANQQIEIDLDDGVKENYAKFDEVLKNI